MHVCGHLHGHTAALEAGGPFGSDDGEAENKGTNSPAINRKSIVHSLASD